MAGKYVSRYTGQEIDEGIRKANEAAEYMDTYHGIPIANTKTLPGSSSGVDYTVEIQGLPEDFVQDGAMLVVIPHATSQRNITPTLTVNEDGAYDVKKAGSSINGLKDVHFVASHPYFLIFNAGNWVCLNIVSPILNDLGGSVSVSQGGTGKGSFPNQSFLVGRGTNALDALDWSEGAEFFEVLSLHGGTMAGALKVQEPTEGAHAASKAYVDGLLGNVAEVLDGINGEAV